MTEIDNLFSGDGMIHAVSPVLEKRSKTIKGRREVINEVSYKDARVCLGCTMEECEGERKCFKMRRKWLQTECSAVSDLPILLDDLIYADEFYEDFDYWDDCGIFAE